MKDVNIPLLTKYIIELIDNSDNKNKTEISYKCKELFLMFNSYIEFGKYEFKTNLTRFGMEMKEYVGITSIKKRDSNYYIINVNELKQHLIDNKIYVDEFKDELIINYKDIVYVIILIIII